MEQKHKELTSRISLEIVQEMAPDEVDLFDDFAEEFYNNPDAFLEKDPKKKEQLLGFALPAGSEQFFITVILPIVWNVVKKIIDSTVDEIRDEKRIKELEDQIFDEAKSSGIDEDKAKQIAESLSQKITTV